MRQFHGDLLLGGEAIREVEGVFDNEVADAGCHHQGRFEVDAQKQSLLELGRPYLLMMDDGGCVKLVLNEIGETSDHGRLVVQFQSTS